ncbi:MAG TPA: TetR/AcrR family transcriptional regulator [Ferruginibacter sp.]|jgi:TetR/AcrR family transcriptional repressor of nem operon|nr:TetR/AcrR family transcriptional regulator [Ferruginibacter sp.]
MSKAEKTRQFIIEKTAPIFNTKGYAGTSLNDMTASTGLTKGSIYGNFANKDEVALAAFDYNLQQVSNIISDEMSKQESIQDKLLVYVTVYSNCLKQTFPTGGCPILNTAIEADDTHPELRKKAIAAILSWKHKVTKLIEKGIENNEFNPSIDPEQIALTIIAMIEGGTMLAKLTGKYDHRKSVMQSVEKLIIGLAK